MTTQEYQSRVAACRTVGAVEQLLMVWFTVAGTYQELVALREAVEARLVQLAEDGAEVGSRGAATADLAA